MELKTELIKLVERTQRLEQEFAAGLSDEERLAAGAIERWAAKDVQSHTAVWIQRLANNLSAARVGSETSAFNDIDEHNNEAFFMHQFDSWEAVRASSDAAFQSTLAELSLYDSKLLERTDLLPGRPRPVWRVIAGTTCLHPIAHLSSYYSQNGRPSEAGRIYAEIVPLLTPLSDDPEWQSLVKYDLACGYALAGDKQRAIAALTEALDMAPEFIEWSKQDPDLASLRDEPGYKSLYPQEPQL